MLENKGKRKIKVVEVNGSSYEMGFQYGTACPEIRKMLDTIYQVFGGRDKARMLATKYIPMYLPAAEEYTPEIVDEMRGIADGIKLDFQDIFFLNITYEISVPSIIGCTSFAAAGKSTNNGEVITGQNFDFLSMWEEIMILLKMKPTRGPNILAIAPAGSLGLIGLNSAGISLNLNLLRNKDSLTPSGGVPAHIILRKVLTSVNIGEGVEAIASVGKKSAKNYLLASDKGDIVDLEVTLDDLNVHYPERGIITHANNFKTDRFRNTDLAPTYWPDSFIRDQKLSRFMDNYYGRLSVDVMKQILQDHSNYPNSICRHPDPKAPLPMSRMIKTLISLISCPKERKVYIALGNPCENQFEEYQL
jgi:isopenicillin-N N-acyltransferase-like protein